jgi:hypothetical protein
MKIAIQISGQPRFNMDFNTLLDTLHDHEVDCYFHLWSMDSTAHPDLISPTWPKTDAEVYAKISSNLPTNCQIAELKIVPQVDYTAPENLNLTVWSNPVNIWYTYYGIKQANNLRVASGKHYDLVIKGRPDAGLARMIDYELSLEYLKNNPLTVVTPNDRRFGLAGPVINDLIAFGLPDTITTYCNAVDNFNLYNDQGCPYHGESLLAWHLCANKIEFPETNFNCTFREFWYKHNRIDFGVWA